MIGFPKKRKSMKEKKEVMILCGLEIYQKIFVKKKFSIFFNKLVKVSFISFTSCFLLFLLFLFLLLAFFYLSFFFLFLFLLLAFFYFFYFFYFLLSLISFKKKKVEEVRLIKDSMSNEVYGFCYVTFFKISKKK